MGSEIWRSLVWGNATGLAASLAPQKRENLLHWDHWALRPRSGLNEFYLMCFGLVFLETPVSGLRNSEVGQYLNSIVSGDTFLFFLLPAFLSAAAEFLELVGSLQTKQIRHRLAFFFFKFLLCAWGMGSDCTPIQINGSFGKWLALHLL